MNAPFDDIRDTLTHARLCADAWWLFEGAHDHRSAMTEGFGRFPVLYETLRPALYSCFIVKLCSLFGTRDDEITLKCLPKAEEDSEFARIWDAGRTLHRYRSKLIAHRDNRKTPEEIAADTGMRYQDERDLIDDTCRLFERLAMAQGVAGLHDVDCQAELLDATELLARPAVPA